MFFACFGIFLTCLTCLFLLASRKACALHLAIDMFKHYSDLKNLRMCNNIRG